MSFKEQAVAVSSCLQQSAGKFFSLASVLAKELLNGQQVVCVRAEDINISGSLYRNKLKYANFRRKHMNTNPRQGPFHFRSPAKILWRTIRGMVPHKTARGAAALDKLKTFEGIPHPYDRKKRMVVPSCLKVLRLRPERRFCRLGDLSKEVGWKHGALIQRLESQRKVKSEAFYKKKTASLRAKNEAKKAVKLSADEMKVLESAGYACLASVLAKELLNGQPGSPVAVVLPCTRQVVCVRAEDINISGSLYRNKLKYANFRRKHMNTNPRQGPFHFRSPAKILWRTIRGMVPHKTARGAAALDKLKTFEGIPHPYDRKKRMVVPSCLKVLRLRPERRFCRLGDLSKEVGWKHGALIQRLESQRKVKSEAFYKKKTASLRAKNEAKKAVKLSADEMKVLESAGYA
ncbi:unnamed protein product [Cladocopium goreaui]|uniref:Large ribosomal subunit protein uL13 (60S ribosomal protein L13a) n=1 Tax=Cladocopium goreaui TaxID=2562237 RepID=A0A9P1FUC7_9DINO|nr:unnamed protein product [Cladocopium goreaui]